MSILDKFQPKEKEGPYSLTERRWWARIPDETFNTLTTVQHYLSQKTGTRVTNRELLIRMAESLEEEYIAEAQDPFRAR